MARVLQGAQHELGEGPRGRRHLVRHVRRHQNGAARRRAHAAVTLRHPSPPLTHHAGRGLA